MKKNKKKKRKVHKHDWTPSYDPCWECGSYTESCADCPKDRLCTANGKCKIE